MELRGREWFWCVLKNDSFVCYLMLQSNYTHITRR